MYVCLQYVYVVYVGASNVNKETEVEMDTQGFVFNTLKLVHMYM